MFDLTNLNPPQREAVEHCGGSTRILAGAGSGKTRVLTYKIAYLVSQGMKPWRILAVTFTNKAAREMAGRAGALLGIPVERLWIGTFHGICVRILRREAENWGFRRDFSIYDDNDRLSVIKKSLADLGITKERLAPSRVKGIIGKAKNDFVSPDELVEFVTGPDADILARVYKRYQERLRDAAAFDFDDLLVTPVRMFRAHPESLDRWRHRFDHILVDEYQDTNRTQYLLLRLLSEQVGGITVVGDDDQSIYRWRGADIRNILEFERDYKDVKTIRLEQNYRSTQTILSAANAVVSNNTKRMAKKLWTDRQGGDTIRVLECLNDRDEAERVIGAIQENVEKQGKKYRDSVILYRTNAQSRAFEDVLRRKAIPYTIVGGVRFYERKEIKDLLAYLRLLANPDDEVSFNRAISTPRRGIGEKTAAVIEEYARENGISILESMAKAGEYLGGAAAGKVKGFYEVFKDAGALRGKKAGLDELAQSIVAAIGYEEYLGKSEPETFEERIDNVNELITAMGEFENVTGEEDLSAFLAEVSLVADVDRWDDQTDTLTLMTMHSAKGLEFPSVYIAGVERGLFPLPQSFDDPAELEEERRLCYVGITRAEDTLTLSYALQRMRYGSYSGGASMFVSEIPFDSLTIEAPELPAAAQPYTERSSKRRRQPVRRQMEYEDYSQEPVYDDGSMYRVGAFVRHPSFGRGKITAKSGSGDKTVLTIMFGARTKKIMAKFAKLMPA